MTRDELKNLLLSFTEEDFYKNVDLHIHSDESDGEISALEILKQAKERNLKYISICDHNTVEAYRNSNILANDIVIPAVEFDCVYKGCLMHIIGYGINIDDKKLSKFFSKTEAGKRFNIVRLFSLRSPKKVIKAIKEAGGIAVWAHPACCWINIEKTTQELIQFGIEGMEVYYPYNDLRGLLKFHSKEKVKELAEKYNLIKTGGTDSHDDVLLS